MTCPSSSIFSGTQTLRTTGLVSFGFESDFAFELSSNGFDVWQPKRIGQSRMINGRCIEAHPFDGSKSGSSVCDERRAETGETRE